jgi:peptide/nickel transport system substrate-binding protein
MAEDRTRRVSVSRRAVAGAAALLAVGLMVTSCGGSPAPHAASGSIYFAEAPGAAPNYIFPYAGCKYFSVSNLNQFQFLMYRPLYWFGLGSSIDLQPKLSPAKKPVFSDGNTKVTIRLKGWQFSNGQLVDAQSVMFFLNMYKADPTSYCGYNAGYGIPDELASATGSNKTVTLRFTKPVSPTWMLYNYLSEITPMPEAWDRASAGAAPGSGRCSTGAFGAPATDAACRDVEQFLAGQAVRTTTYTDALWQVVDGPWRLSAFTKGGDASFVPNPKYSGRQHAQVKHVYLEAFATAAAEEAQLKAGKLTIGYVDPGSLPGPAPGIDRVGPNVADLKSKYKLMTGTPWSFNYAAINFAPRDPKSPELKLLYVRQALQDAIDQIGIINAVDKGYGVPTCSPIPLEAPLSVAAPIGCAYPYSLAAARALLASHGWKVVKGVQTCRRAGTKPADCGPDVANGATLSFALIFQNGSPALTATLDDEISAWSAIGIRVSHTESEFDKVVQQCDGGAFQICSWHAGWVYAPDYFPSGETLFTAGGSFNPGQYLSATMTALVTQSVTEKVNLTAYGQFAAVQLPVLYEPNPTALLEVSRSLQGVRPPNPLQNFMPEFLHF